MVSVIVPTRNSARTIRACLHSIRNQRDCEVELIVIDNHSTDETRTIADALADCLKTAGSERSAQRNCGAQVARGSYFLFIDSDMTLQYSVVAECLANGTDAVIIPEDSVGEGFWAHCRTLERSCYHGDDAIEAARFFRRGAFEAVGGYDLRLTAGEDWDLSDRIAKGRPLPRIQASIIHDEGHLRLWPHLAKKLYYGRSLAAYWRKPTARRGTLIRSAYLRNWRTLLRHPLLTLGVIFLKSAEAVAFASGVVVGRIRQL